MVSDSSIILLIFTVVIDFLILGIAAMSALNLISRVFLTRDSASGLDIRRLQVSPDCHAESSTYTATSLQ